MRGLLNKAIDAFQAKFPPNRLVALAMVVLVPLVVAPAASYVATWAPAHLPELPTFTAAQLQTFGTAGLAAGLLAGIVAGYKFIDGWQYDEARKHGSIEAARERHHELRMAIAQSDQPHVTLEAVEALSAPPGASSEPSHDPPVVGAPIDPPAAQTG